MVIALSTKKSRVAVLIAVMFVATAFFLPHYVHAQDYQPLTAIPGVPSTGGSLVDYINALFILSVIVGGLLAVIKIAIGGFQYMMSDVVTSKDSAKKDITGALLGLGILLASVTVLYTINHNLINLDFLSGAEPVSISGQQSSGSVGPNESAVREQVRNDNPLVISTFTGTFGSPEHTAFVKKCMNEYHGTTVYSATGDGKTVECRAKEAAVPLNNPSNALEARSQCEARGTSYRYDAQTGECLTTSGSEIPLSGTTATERRDQCSLYGTAAYWDESKQKCYTI